MAKVLIIVGSLREKSFNRQLARAAEARLAGRAETEMLEYADVPFMNQDVEFPPPEAVERVRAAVRAADALWIFTPEYNYSYPGVLKNLLDWLSRPVVPGERATAVTAGKPVAVSSCAGRSAGAGSRAKLTELLRAMQAVPLEEPQVGVSLDGAAFASDEVPLTDEILAGLDAEASALLAAVAA